MPRKRYSPDMVHRRNIERFNAFIMPVTESGCWIWLGCINKQTGYGMLNANRKTTLAHRFIWEYEYGEIPKGYSILHKCDVRSCVNPLHLFIGTQKENMHDMIKKGRAIHNKACKGEKQGSAKLTEAQILEIRKLKKTGLTFKAIGLIYKVSSQTIFRIHHSKKHGGWAHVI